MSEDAANEMAAAIGRRLKHTRTVRGFGTQVALGTALGHQDGGMVHLWEKGKRAIQAFDLLALCRLLGVTSDWLLFGETRGLSPEAYEALVSKPGKKKAGGPKKAAT